MKNYYEILEIPLDASLDEIKKAFRIKAIKYHPDKHFGDTYFTSKFIEVKEAYEILSDDQRRKDYDIFYNNTYIKEEPHSQEKRKEEKRKDIEKEEKFFYDPYKPFYSFQDRIQQETPQYNPKINHWGEAIDEKADFFVLPNKIGKIISGFTTLSKGETPSTTKQNIFRIIKSILIGAAISLFIIYVFKVEEPVWIGIWAIAPIIIGIWLASKASEFKHSCNFIGINGFAEYKCENSRDNITSSFEINFNDITDLIKMAEVRKRNFQYMNTAFSFAWFKNDQIVKEVNDIHDSKEDNPERTQTNFWLNTWAERYWTIYLLDKMENELEKNGFLQFNLFGFKDDRYIKIPYIHLGIGYIKFITEKGEFTYSFNDIKRVYTKGTDLFIEHKNYEKKFLFFESGNKNGIPLMLLSNRQFFFRAMDLLLGYKFS